MVFFKNIFSSQTTISNCLIFFHGKKIILSAKIKQTFQQKINEILEQFKVRKSFSSRYRSLQTKTYIVSYSNDGFMSLLFAINTFIFFGLFTLERAIFGVISPYISKELRRLIRSDSYVIIQFFRVFQFRNIFSFYLVFMFVLVTADVQF